MPARTTCLGATRPDLHDTPAQPGLHGIAPARLRRDRRARRHRPRGIEADILAGRADYAREGFPTDDVASLYHELGPGSPHQQFFVTPGLGLRFLALNTTRRLFAGARIRRALNLAIDRQATVEATGAFSGTATDQILPPGLSAFRDADIYPLAHPDFQRARRLVGSTTGTAQIFTCDLPFCVEWARIVKRDLERIGLHGDIHVFPLDEYFTHITTPGEPWDIAPASWDGDYADRSTSSTP